MTILQYNDAYISFGSPFEMFSCFILGEYLVSWLQASKLGEERERAMNNVI